MESFIGRFKAENRSLFLDAKTFRESGRLVVERDRIPQRRATTLDDRIPTTHGMYRTSIAAGVASKFRMPMSVQ